MQTRNLTQPLTRAITRSITQAGAGGGGSDPLAAAKSLFASGEQGYIYDPSVLSSMFQDLAETVPAAVGQPVYRRRDLSGNNCHWTANSSAARPILRFAGGLYYLEWDGIDDGGQSGSIDFQTLGEATLIIGCRKERDTGAGPLAALTADFTVAGGFLLAAPGYSGPTLGVAARSDVAGVNAGAYVNNATFAAPWLGTFTAQVKAKSSPLCEIRLNGNVEATSGTPQGTGSYPTGPVLSGAAGGNYFLGRTYLEIMRNKLTSGALLTAAEALVTARR